MTPVDAPLTKKDFKSDQDVRWCPGCGDYGILNAVQQAFAKIGLKKHETVIVSGIGCSSRFPYYMDTFGFHTIHGRAPALATGVKLSRPELNVWVVTGDGDALSIGGNHLIHVLRRNVGLKILLFNNRIYGLTKGQYSPTSEKGKRTKSTPVGSVDEPFSPIALALGAGASFVARSIDIFAPHLISMIERMAAHKGTALLEIYQNCNIFNDGAFASFTEKSVRGGRVVELHHGQPMLFDDERQALVVDADSRPGLVTVGEGGTAVEDLPVWDEQRLNPAPAMAIAHAPEATMPVPIGVFRAIERPAFESEVGNQMAQASERKIESLDELLAGSENWVVE